MMLASYFNSVGFIVQFLPVISSIIVISTDSGVFSYQNVKFWSWSLYIFVTFLNRQFPFDLVMKFWALLLVFTSYHLSIFLFSSFLSPYKLNSFARWVEERCLNAFFDIVLFAIFCHQLVIHHFVLDIYFVHVIAATIDLELNMGFGSCLG